MTNASLLRVAIVGVLGAAVTPAADAVFHLMQIEQVIGGVNGDTTVQAIQLRMRSTFQQFVTGARVRVWDAQGQNPILLTDFGMDVLFDQPVGRRVLIATASFSGVLDGPLAPDFIMVNLIPASYLAAGSITFEDDPFMGNDGTIWWRLSWGGAGYTGGTDGASVEMGGNDFDGDFGRWPEPPAVMPLPSAGVQALQFQGPATALSTNNADDYALTTMPVTFTNNANGSATICPWDCQAAPTSGAVDVPDLLAFLGAWGGPQTPGTTCDLVVDGVINVPDLLELLGNWGPCP